MTHLGDGCDLLATDVSEGGPGNGERIVFLYDTRRVAFRGIAGELTLGRGREVRDAGGVELSSRRGWLLWLGLAAERAGRFIAGAGFEPTTFGL